MDMFFNWLQDNFPQGVILVAHNAFGSDARLITEVLGMSGWNDDIIESVIHGFSDTQVAFKKTFSGRFHFLPFNIVWYIDKDIFLLVR